MFIIILCAANSFTASAPCPPGGAKYASAVAPEPCELFADSVTNAWE